MGACPLSVRSWRSERQGIPVPFRPDCRSSLSEQLVPCGNDLGGDGRRQLRGSAAEGTGEASDPGRALAALEHGLKAGMSVLPSWSMRRILFRKRRGIWAGSQWAPRRFLWSLTVMGGVKKTSRMTFGPGCMKPRRTPVARVSLSRFVLWQFVVPNDPNS